MTSEVWIQVQFQSDVFRSIDERMDFERLLRSGSGSDCFDDRELSIGIHLAVDAKVSLHCHRASPRRIFRRLASGWAGVMKGLQCEAISTAERKPQPSRCPLWSASSSSDARRYGDVLFVASQISDHSTANGRTGVLFPERFAVRRIKGKSVAV